MTDEEFYQRKNKVLAMMQATNDSIIASEKLRSERFMEKFNNETLELNSQEPIEELPEEYSPQDLYQARLANAPLWKKHLEATTKYWA